MAQGVVSVEQLAFVNGALDTSALVFTPIAILTLALQVRWQQLGQEDCSGYG